jgi:lysyl-tRNA synthetase class 1
MAGGAGPQAAASPRAPALTRRPRLSRFRATLGRPKADPLPDPGLPPLDLSPALVEAAERSKAWPFEEARKVVARIARQGVAKAVIFETGYGPSGLPHIGTFGEVARTTMVRTAFRLITGDTVPTRLICFSDDMDGLRKVPTNVPNQESMGGYIGQPLTSVPDPFGEYDSFGGGNNARLRRFLDRFGFDYEFMSATETYKSGRFDATLLKMLAAYDAVMAIMLPSLGEERQQSYSPFLPVSPTTGAVLQVPIVERRVEAGTIVFRDPDNADKLTEVPVTGGHVKCQWKADWALRWAALGVDYEMSGKDLIDSVRLSARICKALGGDPPDGFNYELFLDENGQKISKSKGNGLTIDEWLAYAAPESLSLYMFHKPKAAKKLYFDVIPRAVDEYFVFLNQYPGQDADRRLGNPVWHIHSGNPPTIDMPVTFTMLLNLASASNTHDRSVLWGFIRRHIKGVTPETHPKLDQLVGYAVRYYNDFVLPKKTFRPPDEVERHALAELDKKLSALPLDADSEAIQSAILDVARAIPRYQDHEREGPRGGPGVSVAWFSTLYQILLGQERGPRFGSFVAIYGIPETRALIRRALAGELVA